MQALCVCAFLALAVWAVFGQTAHFGFVDYDDPANVSANPVVAQGLSVKAVGWAFTHAQLANWIPLTTLSHILDCQIFGLRAGGHHLVNVLFHAATAMLLFLVLRLMTGSLWRSAFVAALFAVHPLRAESVAWVSERKDVLSAFFFMLAIGAYVGYVEKRKASSFAKAMEDRESRKQKFFYALTLVFFALGLLAKSMVATLPFVLLLLDWWPLARLKAEGRRLKEEGGEQRTAGLPFWGLVKEKIPLLALSAGACAAAALVPGLVVMDAHRLPLLERIGNAVVSYAIYLGQMVFPVGLAIPYPNPPNGQPIGKVCLAFVLLAAISAGVVVWRKKRPCLLAGWLWYLGMLVPVIGIIQISPDASHADRYTYLPGIGLAMAVTWAVADASAGWRYRRVVLGGLMMAVIGALTVCAHSQTSYWKDDESLWRRALACTSGNYVAEHNLGNALVKHGKLDDAIEHFQKALVIQPGLAEPRYNLANALFKQGNLEEAAAQYRKLLEIQPGNAEAFNNLGNALAMQGDNEAAIAQYQKALEIQPRYGDAHYNLAQVLLQQGKLDAAIVQYRKSLETEPYNAEAQSGLGKALFLKADFDGAMACFDKAAALGPDPVAGWRKLGDDFLQKEDWQIAIACYQRAVKINPRDAEAAAGLGMACFKKGEAKEAIASWRHALAIYSGQISVLNNLAWLLATTSDPSLRNGTEAVALATQASQASGGGNPVILHTLAVAYAAEGNYRLAAATARRALQLAVGQKKDTLAATLQQEVKLYEASTPPGNAPQ